jgi:hypothetical protein
LSVCASARLPLQPPDCEPSPSRSRVTLGAGDAAGQETGERIFRGKTEGMADAMSNSASTPGMDPDEPIPDTPAELDEPELPAPPIESTPDDPGGDPGAEPAEV